MVLEKWISLNLSESMRVFREVSGESPVTIICDVPIVTYSGKLEEFERFISNNSNSIIVMDENSDFVRTKEFSEIVF